MPCYRKGGCGPYENRSCTECPASKADYLDKADRPENRRKPARRTRFKPDAKCISGYALRTMKPLAPNELTMENIRGWLNAHEIRSGRFALSLPPRTDDPPSETCLNYAQAADALMDEESPVRQAAMLAAERVLDAVSERQCLPDPLPAIRFPTKDNTAFRLTGIPEVDMVMSPNQRIIQRYNLVRAFDAACQAAWYVALYGLTTIEAIDPDPDYSDHDRLVKLRNQFTAAVRIISGNHDANNDNDEDMIGYLVEANLSVTEAVAMVYPADPVDARDIIWSAETAPATESPS